ncbi:MFS transporter [Paenibacillus sp. OAS669]|uniref:MFS transporter n=1 Tax=Paenibacillus sp. OAS669 TaxID=2663821 RepID=UPI00178BF909|nr:MFS transporter [Paenibacillus sp. OAS669]MBE1441257.1 DHA2 family metal-tetracycline-proton antiporter-like MFS transporter [Paenibacillus sp. OAS669]
MNTDVKQQGDSLIRILMFTVMLSSMSALMFNIVLPEMSEEFQLSIAQVSWISSAYTLIYAVGTVTYGKLADQYKLKSVITFGLVLFGVGSLIGLCSQTFVMALIGRCIQSAGAAAIPATAMLIPVRYFAPERRGVALGMTATGLALGSAIGPVVSSLIVSVAHWRWLFAVPLLILITLPFYRKHLGDERGTPAPFDWIGGLALALTVVLLLISVTNGGWWFALGGLIAAAGFIWRIRTAAVPFVQPGLFRHQPYASGVVLAFIINGIGMSLYFITPLLLSQVHQLSPQWIGMAMVPAAVASAILGRKGGKLADARGNAFLFNTASLLLIACFLLLSAFLGISPLWVSAILILGNVGQSYMMITMSNTISRTLEPKQTGVGMGMFSMLNFISQAIGTGVYSTILDIRTTHSWNPLNLTPGGAIFSNIYLVLGGLHVLIFMAYYFQYSASRTRAEVRKQG